MKGLLRYVRRADAVHKDTMLQRELTRRAREALRLAAAGTWSEPT